MARLTTADLTSLTDEQSAVSTINANFALIETLVEALLYRDGTDTNTLSAEIDMNSHKIVNLSTPTSGADAATKDYVDGLAHSVNTTKTADYTILAADNGTIFDTLGAAGTVIFTLPTAVRGYTYSFYVGAAFTLEVLAPASTTIQVAGSTSAAAGHITNATVGGAIKLVAMSTTSWVAMNYVGTWTVT